MNMLRIGELPDSYIKDILEAYAPYGNIVRSYGRGEWEGVDEYRRTAMLFYLGIADGSAE